MGNTIFVYSAYGVLVVLLIIGIIARWRNLRKITSLPKVVFSFLVPLYLMDMYLFKKSGKFRYIILFLIVDFLVILTAVNMINFLIFRFFNDGPIYHIYPLYLVTYGAAIVDILIHKNIGKNL